ncbi:MAG: ankyrin repeat domain-containing protein [Thermoguttaceae bacterium]|nr:ankyrin repeat domain-containing protein [Thermoguttaceae bacterium]
MNSRKTILSVLFVLLVCLAGACFAAEDSDIQKQQAISLFGKDATDRFEQMFQSGEFDFDYRCNHSMYSGANVLHYTVWTGDINRVKTLLERGADVNAKTDSGESVLESAVQSGNFEMVQFLVERGADVNAKDEWGATVLHTAAHSGNLEMVQFLIERGADVNAKDDAEKTVLNYAILGDVRKPVLNSTDQSDALKMVQWLVKCGANVNAKDRWGHSSLLHEAVFNDDLELVKWLVERGVDVNTTNKMGWTALYTAKRYGKTEIAQWLKDHGAKTFVVNWREFFVFFIGFCILFSLIMFYIYLKRGKRKTASRDA